MLHEIEQDTKRRMSKTIDTLQQGLNKLRTGRAHPSLLDNIKVNSYGQEVPLSQVASIVAEDARTLSIKPWDRSMVESIDRAIHQSDLGLNPVTAGVVIRLPLPALTEERRKTLSKSARQEGENAKVALRNVRRDANQQLKEFQKSGEITEDQVRNGEVSIQKLTDDFTKKIDAMISAKEQELMQI